MNKAIQFIMEARTCFTEQDKDEFLDRFTDFVMSGETCVALSEADLGVEGENYNRFVNKKITDYPESCRDDYMAIRDTMKEIVNADITFPSVLAAAHFLDRLESLFFTWGCIARDEREYIWSRPPNVIDKMFEAYDEAKGKSAKVTRMAKVKAEIAELTLLLKKLESE